MRPGLINAHVFVPPDLAPNTLTTCSATGVLPADFEAGTCLGNTVVGNAVATSPLLSSALAGQVLLVDNGGLLPNIGLDLRGQLHLLLQGSLNTDKSVTFAGLPDIPIAHFQLAFTNPPGLLIANRDLCVGPPPVFHADFTGYNGASTSVDSTATVQGCGGRRQRRDRRKCREGEEEAQAPRRRVQEAQEEALLQEEVQDARRSPSASRAAAPNAGRAVTASGWAAKPFPVAKSRTPLAGRALP